MQGLLIANKDRDARHQLADLFTDDDCQVTTTDSVMNALQGILDTSIQVVVLVDNFDETNVVKLVPLLKKCNRYLSIILVSDELPLNLLRMIRKEGIFYHALNSAAEECQAEIYQAVHSAFKAYQAQKNAASVIRSKEVAMRNAKTLLTSLVLILVTVAPGLAADTTTTYTSGILVLVFVGFCALLVVLQLLPAIRSLFKITKEMAQKPAESNYHQSHSTKKS